MCGEGFPNDKNVDDLVYLKREEEDDWFLEGSANTARNERMTLKRSMKT